MSWVSIAKPSVQAYVWVNPQGKETYDQTDVYYDDPNVFYDGVNQSQWTNISKPTSSVWTYVAKPTF